MTFLFAADVATVILPIALGASVLHLVFAAQHTAIYVAGSACSRSCQARHGVL